MASSSLSGLSVHVTYTYVPLWIMTLSDPSQPSPSQKLLILLWVWFLHQTVRTSLLPGKPGDWTFLCCLYLHVIVFADEGVLFTCCSVSEDEPDLHSSTILSYMSSLVSVDFFSMVSYKEAVFKVLLKGFVWKLLVVTISLSCRSRKMSCHVGKVNTPTEWWKADTYFYQSAE